MKRNFYIIILVLVVASVLLRIICNYHFEQTTILFIGLPALLSILIVKYSESPKNLYGLVFRVITLFLLISLIFLGEGVICVIMAAPIFYATGGLVVALYKWAKKYNNKRRMSITIIPIILLIGNPLSHQINPEIHSVTSTQKTSTVDFESFNRNPDFMIGLPKYLQSGFPKPVAITGNGIDVGDQRTIDFLSNTKGVGKLTLEITEKTSNSITFEPVYDDTHIHHWLTWKKINVKINDNQEIEWTTQYTCDLGPSWYFEPIERYTVKIMNQHLINAYFNK